MFVKLSLLTIEIITLCNWKGLCKYNVVIIWRSILGIQSVWYVSLWSPRLRRSGKIRFDFLLFLLGGLQFLLFSLTAAVNTILLLEIRVTLPPFNSLLTLHQFSKSKGWESYLFLIFARSSKKIENPFACLDILGVTWYILGFVFLGILDVELCSVLLLLLG